MQIVAVAEVLAADGLVPPVLNVLVPNEQKYTALLMQPQGDIEISGAVVRNRDRALAAAQFGAFLREACETDADLVVTPEYSMPWSSLAAAIQASTIPAQGKLWAIGCESIRYNELEQLKQDLAPFATVIFETLPAQQDRFLDPLAYVFLTQPADGNGAAKLVMLVQFKTFPMADLSEAMEYALQENRESIEAIFARIHSPAEFRGLGTQLATLIRKENGQVSALSQISTGQRRRLHCLSFSRRTRSLRLRRLSF